MHKALSNGLCQQTIPFAFNSADRSTSLPVASRPMLTRLLLARRASLLRCSEGNDVEGEFHAISVYVSD